MNKRINQHGHINVANGSHGHTLTEVDSPFIFIDKETLSFRSEGISYFFNQLLSQLCCSFPVCIVNVLCWNCHIYCFQNFLFEIYPDLISRKLNFVVTSTQVYICYVQNVSSEVLFVSLVIRIFPRRLFYCLVSDLNLQKIHKKPHDQKYLG